MSSSETTALLGGVLLVDKEEAARELARNWGWLQVVGILDIFCGIAALISPIVATQVAYLFVVAALFVAGCFSISGLCYAEKGQKYASFFLGVAQVVVALVLYFHPLGGVMGFTIVIAIVFMMDGVFRMGVALQNRDMPGWGWMLADGIAAVVLSITVISAFPASALYTMGILLGVNLLTLGMSRTALSCVGRSIANTNVDSGELLGV